MQRIQRIFDGRAIALTVFLAVYVGLLTIAFAPRDGVGASPYELSSRTGDASLGSRVLAAG